MQYIQFQPQSSSQVPDALSGTVNIFVDTSDNSVKTKDENGVIVNSSGGMSIIETTKTLMDTWISDATLSIGQFYKITGVHTSLYGGTDIILQATSESTLSKQGWGSFYNPRYQDPNITGVTAYYVWNNLNRIGISGTTGYFIFDEPIIGDQGQTGQLYATPGLVMTFLNNNSDWTTTTHITGQTSSAVTTSTGYVSVAQYNIDDKVIWGGRVWENLTGAVGSTEDPNPPTKQLYLDVTNWSFVTYNTTDYQLVWDLIEYEYEFDNISFRKDATNEVRCNNAWFSSVDSWRYNNINRFPWGHPLVSNVKISNSYLDSLLNLPNQNIGYLKNVSFDNGGGFDANNWGWGTQISGITADKTAKLVGMSLGDGARFSNLTLEQGSLCDGLGLSNNDTNIDQFKDIKVGGDSVLTSNYIDYNSYIQNLNLDLSCTFSDNFLHRSSNFHNVSLKNNARLSNVVLYPSSQLYYATVGANANFRNISSGLNTSLYDIEIDSETYFGDISFNANFCEISYINLKTNAYFQNLIFNGNYTNIKYVDLGVNAGFYQTILNTSCQANFIGLANNSYVNSLIMDDSSIFNYIQLGVNGTINDCNIGSTFSLTNIKIDVGSSLNGISFFENVDSAYLGKDSSTFQTEIDISNLSSINLSNYNFAGLITLTSSNSAESISQVLSGATFQQRLQPETGLTVVFIGTQLTGITSNGLIKMPTSTFVINGSNYDYITFDTVFDGTHTSARKIDGQNYL